MVPFAAVNLKVATEGVTHNCGLFIVAFLLMMLGIIWVFFWAYTAVGVAYSYAGDCQDRHPGSNFQIGSDDYDPSCDPPLVSVIFFLLSLYWTVTVTMVRHQSLASRCYHFSCSVQLRVGSHILLVLYRISSKSLSRVWSVHSATPRTKPITAVQLRCGARCFGR
jgi:hypothetical protein